MGFQLHNYNIISICTRTGTNKKREGKDGPRGVLHFEYMQIVWLQLFLRQKEFKDRNQLVSQI